MNSQRYPNKSQGVPHFQETENPHDYEQFLLSALAGRLFLRLVFGEDNLL